VQAARVVLALALAPPATALLGELDEPLHGAHTFRQAHVAANIEKYVSGGLSLRPSAYNVDVPGALFDFPLYQLGVAALVRATGLPPLETARAVNVGLWAATLLAGAALLRELRAGAVERALALGLVAWSPLLAFYAPTPLVDPLAVLLSLLSLLGYLRWDARGGRAAATLMWLTGVLACLIKNPVYLPVLMAMGCERLRRRGARSLLQPGFFALVAASGLAVVLFKLYSNHVNQSGAFLPADEAAAYFGTWADRLRRKYWRALAESLGERVLPTAAGLTALLGLAWGGRSRSRLRAVGIGLACGVALTLLLFFGRHREHDYYQLAFVFPAALLAGRGLTRALAAARLARARGRPLLARLGQAAVLAVLAAGAASAQATWRAMGDVPGAAELQARGAWLRAHTRPGDFVAVVVGGDAANWDPSHLYFAQRDGSNLAHAEVTPETFAELRARFPGYRRVLLFVPWTQRAAMAARLPALDARPLDSGETGDLYEIF
jgi:hypothetical protein